MLQIKFSLFSAIFTNLSRSAASFVEYRKTGNYLIYQAYRRDSAITYRIVTISLVIGSFKDTLLPLLNSI